MSIRQKGKRVPPEAVLIGENLRALREKRGLSQQEIARILGVSFQQVQKYEKGTNRLPLEKLFILKHFYAISYNRIFDVLEIPPNPEQDILKKVAKLRDDYVRSRFEEMVLLFLECV